MEPWTGWLVAFTPVAAMPTNARNALDLPAFIGEPIRGSAVRVAGDGQTSPPARSRVTAVRITVQAEVGNACADGMTSATSKYVFIARALLSSPDRANPP
jgi:hypothetical protein